MKTPAKTSVILLAGGTGSRMQSALPKQFLELGGKPIACHSLNVFLDLPSIDEIIVVCHPDFREFFRTSSPKPVLFALPGKRRQDSVYNGLQMASHELICVHDAARPFIDEKLVLKVLEAGKQFMAAAVAIPISFTIKECDAQNFVTMTPDRSKLWEIQTPQVLHRDLLLQGFQRAINEGITVTDDVSLAELMGEQVKLVQGSKFNLKLTEPADLAIANHLLHALKP